MENEEVNEKETEWNEEASEDIDIPVYDEKVYDANEVFLEVNEAFEIIGEHSDDTDAIVLHSHMKKNNEALLGKLFVEGKVVEKTLNAQEIEEKEKQRLKEKLSQLYEKMTWDIKNSLTDTVMSLAILAEYRTKEYEARKSLETNDYSFFSISSTLLGVSPEEYVTLVIQKADSWAIEQNKAVGMLGDVRVYISSLIAEGQTEDASSILERVSRIDANTVMRATQEELLVLLGVQG